MNMKVINFKSKNEEEAQKNLEHMLSIIDAFRLQIVNGEVEEFIISYMNMENDVEISANCKDYVGAIGILEMSKQIVLQYNQF